jgi:hypothetical protein
MNEDVCIKQNGTIAPPKLFILDSWQLEYVFNRKNASRRQKSRERFYQTKILEQYYCKSLKFYANKMLKREGHHQNQGSINLERIWKKPD